MSLKVGKVHGWFEVFKIIDDVPHFPDGSKKGKIKWQSTVVTPERMNTFEDFEGTEEEAVAKKKEYNLIKMTRS